MRDVALLHPEEVKLHLLHVLRRTALEKEYESGAYTPLSQEEYVSLVVDALELLPPDVVVGRLTGDGMGEALLAPTRIYVKALKSVKAAGVRIKACSHITGGGFYENIPRMLPEGKHAVIEKNSYPVPPIFTLMAREGNVEEHMMYNTYNMGLGMVLAVDPADVDKTMEAIQAAGETPYVVGKITDGEKGVTLC